ncbi:hypothetical protein HK098_001691 [Nowakowskiella sp. JEL0407]|nr:hypothetical protein HK098_001691 [Nowakowskiella sp. JEL0407]
MVLLLRLHRQNRISLLSHQFILYVHKLPGKYDSVSFYVVVSKSGNPPPSASSNNVQNQPHLNNQQQKGIPPLWDIGRKAHLSVYLSESVYHDVAVQNTPVWQTGNFYYGDYEERHLDVQVPVTDHMAKNGSLYAHVFLTHEDFEKKQSADYVLSFSQLLTKYQPKRKDPKLKKLVGSKEETQSTEPEEEKEGPTPWISYWWSNLTISVVPQKEAMPQALPPTMLQHLRLSQDRNHFLPFFYANEFWMLEEQLIPINDTLKSLNLTIRFQPLRFWQFQMYTQMDESFKLQGAMMGKSDVDEFKRMLVETNPILLGVTMVVSLLHTIFDFLAFKNDIEFWRKRKDMEGLSFRSIILNVFFQTVIFLYLLDNETSWMVLLSSGMGLLIEAWKINKTVIVKRSNAFPWFEFEDRVKPSKKVAKTREYDEMAFKYLSYALYPLLVGYAIYSVMYEQHKGWYSFIINTLVGFVYAFGFITMTPQLFINYKLKSVAHMPWKTFMYKALNTFIDDLFAFVIKMPMLHRLACLRDDVIFFVYLYQRWIYPEDKRRRNEFGQVGEEGGDDDDDDDEDEVEETKSEDKKEASPSKKKESKKSK